MNQHYDITCILFNTTKPKVNGQASRQEIITVQNCAQDMNVQYSILAKVIQLTLVILTFSGPYKNVEISRYDCTLFKTI